MSNSLFDVASVLRNESEELKKQNVLILKTLVRMIAGNPGK